MPRTVKVQTIAGAQRRLRGLHAVSRPAPSGTAPLPVQFPCPYCTFWTTNESGRTRHILNTPSCNNAQVADVERAREARQAAQRVGLRLPLLSGLTLEDAAGEDADASPWVRLDNPLAPGGGTVPSVDVLQADAGQEGTDHGATNERANEGGGEGEGEGAIEGEGEGEGVDLEPDGDVGHDGGDSDAECDQAYVEKYPDPQAGQPINDSRAEPFNLREYMRARGDFANPGYFDIAKTLMTTKLTNVGRETHLKSRLYRGSSPWPNVGAFMAAIDRLPHGPAWKAVTLKVTEGDNSRVVVVYFRDIIEVLRDLIGNTRFKAHMRYAPERHWTSRARRKRVFGEMWTGDWWWNMQALLRDPEATIAPLILASDKTTLSVISGNQQAYPVYLTIGNISKRIRRKTSQRAAVLIGYLPVEDFADVADKNERDRLKGELVHRAMDILLEPLKRAGTHGVEMFCADGRLRRVFPILASYMADYPEQCLMACTSQSSCPICPVAHHHRAEYKETPGRRRRKADLDALGSYMKTEDLAELRQRGLKPWWPFWAYLPHTNFVACVTPDILHQIHKGMFKSHLVKWVSRILGVKRVDRRMAAMTRASGMRHFDSGISRVQKWTGRESKEMAMQFLPVVAESTTDDMVRLTRALLDHMYRGHATRMTEGELEEMEDAWREFHRVKEEVVTLGAMANPALFNRISKMHTVMHWPRSIRQLGTPDGYNTEAPEHMHIEFAKEPWRYSSRVDALPQMIRFIQRQEAIRIQDSHLKAWLSMIRQQIRRRDRELGGEEDDTDDEAGTEDDEEWEDVEEGAEERPDATHYPHPGLAIALSPTHRNVPANQIIENYRAPDLIAALTRFLEREVAKSHGRTRPNQSDRLCVPFLSPQHLFNVWHRLALFHTRLPFAPDESPRRDVVRAKPATRNAYGLVTRPAVFDTVLYRDPDSNNADEHGLHRFFVARVCAIFTPPSVTHRIYPSYEQLAYVELFTPFSRNNNTPHGMYTTSAALHPDGRRRAAVIPISYIQMICHIAPRFAQIPRNVPLNRYSDLLASTKSFFFNHYVNHYRSHSLTDIHASGALERSEVEEGSARTDAAYWSPTPSLMPSSPESPKTRRERKRASFGECYTLPVTHPATAGAETAGLDAAAAEYGAMRHARRTYQHEGRVVSAVVRGELPQRSADAFPYTTLGGKQWQLLRECWSMEATLRPTSATVASEIRNISYLCVPASMISRKLLAHGCQDVTHQLSWHGEPLVHVGGTSVVRRGEFRNRLKVAIKLWGPLVGIERLRVKYTIDEIHIWSQLKHRNLLEQNGFAVFDGQLATITPWMKCRRIVDYVQDRPTDDRWALCSQIAEGVAYLHALEMAHGNLMSRHILCTDNGIVKISGFVSSLPHYLPECIDGNLSNIRWTAPEMLDGDSQFSKHSDVYTLGMIILELVTGHPPYQEHRFGAVMISAIMRGVHPQRPSEFAAGTKFGNERWELLLACWDTAQGRRPSAMSVQHKINLLS
ncbi:hypothetical protein BDV93DRAFT_610591 [Ceratobasidium sp. AG-I]|nr:hypothetical protein BDV93DRAFT_610591 [Ceratobasidium sp. AG-I]